ncbi:MAG: hypothetical protein MJZ78_07790 [Bacteroidales bacterium]|nr:hypothetical protein [Bacteroidales bacterium]
MQRKLLLFLFIAICSFCSAKGHKATVIVVGTGNTKDIATMAALRSAIEQVCGTFIFSTTEISDRRLVVDKLCSISGGKIASYNVLSCLQDKNGQFMVTLEAKIGVSELCSNVAKYVPENKSIEMDLSDLKETYIFNFKLKELHKNSESEAIEAMLYQVMSMIDKDIFYVDKFSCSDPIFNNDRSKVKYKLKATLKYSDKYKDIDKIVYSTLDGLSKINLDDLRQMDEGTEYEIKSKASVYHGLKKRCKVYLLSTDLNAIMSKLSPLLLEAAADYSFYENNVPVSSSDVNYTYSYSELASEIFLNGQHIIEKVHGKIPKSVDFKVTIIKPLETASKVKYTFN